MGKIVYPDCYVELIVRTTHDEIVARSHSTCRISDHYVDSPVASRIIVAGAGSGALQRRRRVAETGSGASQRLAALQGR